MTLRNHLNEYYCVGGFIHYYNDPNTKPDSKIENLFCQKHDLILFKDFTSLIAYRKTHYNGDSEQTHTYYQDYYDQYNIRRQRVCTITEYTKVCYFSVQVDPRILEKTPWQTGGSREESRRNGRGYQGTYEFVTVKPEKITHVNYAFIKPNPRIKNEWIRQINKKPYLLGLTQSAQPYETVWKKTNGSIREKTLAVLKKYKGHFLNRLFQTRTHTKEADALIRAINNQHLSSLDSHELIKTALHHIRDRSHSDFAAMLSFLNAKLTEYQDDMDVQITKEELSMMPEGVMNHILEYADMSHEVLDQSIIQKASENYEKYKNQFCGLRWWSTSDATKKARVDLSKAKTDHERYKIAKEYIEHNRERAFAKELSKFIPRL